jgi:hypothetical protein
MKNKIYNFGWVGSLVTITGGLFKIMHWPFAGIMLTLGLAFLAVVFFPMALYSNYAGLGRKKPLLYLVINLTIFLNIAGSLFKIQHWPWGNYLMVAGILSPLVLFLPVYLYYHIKSKEQSLNNFFSILFLLVLFSVIDVLLTVRVSKDTLDLPIDVMNTTKLNDYFTVKKDICYRKLLNDELHSKSQQALDIKNKSEALYLLIMDIKREITIYANGENKDNIGDYKAIKMKDNANIPVHVLFGEGYKGARLRTSMEDYKESLLLALGGNREGSKYVSQLLQIDKPYRGRTWEEIEFSNSPVIFALYRLNILQDNIALAEIETLNTLCANLKK